ncbi:putative repeat protein (TIGR03806 family) [Chitinophaga niastensis]|uniref:Putative repeat protein (TIGR03806 family) n=1 Tax=Chitinophaga niastensis TaxID=536980 RepID=A0A2P8HJ69_CHINA|nr:SO2930 family diheme c-type cytochrome [Chitinophaga niastensis]PSL46266.1 putative repeat protein (TIGR03806 family) [Chitinophaga niastensis]
MRKPCLFIVIFILVIAVAQSCKQKSAQTSGTGVFQFKEKLSDYGFFTGVLKDLVPRKGVFNYELSTPLFTDYAVKDRFIVLPDGQSMHYTDHGALDFPDSTFIVKNFAYRSPSHQKIMIETRLLFKDPADKQWKVMNYLWDNDQRDAQKWIMGKKIPITFLDDSGQQQSTVYQMPNTNDCKRCHINNSVLTPIGPKARNLNFVRGGQPQNQLMQWATGGQLQGLPAIEKVPVLPGWKDSTHFTVSERARAYLDVNCAHCHTQGGDAYNTGLFLEYEQTGADHIGIMKSPVSAGGGAGGLDYDLIPGDALHSILAYRMNSVEPGTAMPELARTVIHKEGVALIQQWINEMKK